MARILRLEDCPDYAPVLAYWSYNLWYRERDITYDTIIKAYRMRTGETTLPLAWAAIDDDMPVGMASLKMDDLWARKDINPWLASLFVIPEFRNRGIAEQLVSAVLEGAKYAGFPRVYLFTGPSEEIDLAAYYSSRGWQYLEDEIDNDGHPTKIFYYDL